MAVYEKNALLIRKDAAGNKHLIYPITKLDNIDEAGALAGKDVVGYSDLDADLKSKVDDHITQEEFTSALDEVHDEIATKADDEGVSNLATALWADLEDVHNTISEYSNRLDALETGSTSTSSRTLIWQSANPNATLTSAQLPMEELYDFQGLEIVYMSKGRIQSTGFLALVLDGWTSKDITLTHTFVSASAFSHSIRICALEDGVMRFAQCRSVKFSEAEGFVFSAEPTMCVPFQIYGVNV